MSTILLRFLGYLCFDQTLISLTINSIGRIELILIDKFDNYTIKFYS